VKKVLIITYYWPPSGGGGVQRWLKFVKYLRNFGWEPIIYTPEDPHFELQDESLLSDVPEGLEVIKRPIWEPFSLYKAFLGKKAVQKQGIISASSNSFLTKLSIWLRGNYFIPDARVFWVRPSINYLSGYLRKHSIDVMVTTGPPHSLHLIGLEVKKRTGINWLADFRDPWSRWDVLDQLKLTKHSRNSHRKLEQHVLQNADLVLTVSNSLKESLSTLGARNIKVITNGYDFDIVQSADNIPDKFRISHVGLLNTGRNPVLLWQVLAELAEEIQGFADDLEIYLSGTIENAVITSIESNSQLHDKYVNRGYQSHDEVTKVYQDSAILLLLINNTDNASWILPGKMYEYIAQGKPILALGKPESDASDVLTSVGFNPCLRYNNKQKIKAFVRRVYDDFKNGIIHIEGDDVEKYHRRALTKSLAACLDQL
jgi:glycosyltransferase involved in cell wall biosynthesis